ncbi:MAG: hypothetical protein ACFFCQ_06765 [Promethearchaeota archaeon]
MLNKRSNQLKRYIVIIFLLVCTLFQLFCYTLTSYSPAEVIIDSISIKDSLTENKANRVYESFSRNEGRQGAEPTEVVFAEDIRRFTSNKTHPSLERKWFNDYTDSNLNLWAVSDIDGDQISEFAIGTKNSSSFFVISGKNASYFIHRNLEPSKIRCMNFIDIDGDSFDELVIGSENNVTWYDLIDNSSGGFGAAFSDGRNVYEVIGININDDLAEELAVAFWNETTSRVELNFYNISQTATYLYKAAGNYDSIQDRESKKEIWLGVGNFTGDQYQDIVMAHFANNIVFFIDGQDGTLTRMVNLGIAAEVGSLDVGKLDLNPIDDVAIGGYGRVYLVNGTNGNIFVDKPIELSEFEDIGNIYVQDIRIKPFTGIGNPKIMIAGGSRRTAEENFVVGLVSLITPSGDVEYQFEEPGFPLISVDAGDFDNDTVFELVSGSIEGTVTIHDVEFNYSLPSKNYFVGPGVRVIATNVSAGATNASAEGGIAFIAGRQVILIKADTYGPEGKEVRISPYLPTPVDNIEFEVVAHDPSEVTDVIVKILTVDVMGNEEYSEIFMVESQKKDLWKGILFGSPSPDTTDIYFIVELIDMLGNINIMPSLQDDGLEFYTLPLQTNKIWTNNVRYDAVTTLKTDGGANIIAVYQNELTRLSFLDAKNGTEIDSQTVTTGGRSIAMYGTDLDGDNQDDVVLICEDGIYIIPSTGTDTISDITVALDWNGFKSAIGSFAGTDTTCIALSSQDQLMFYNLESGNAILEDLVITETINDLFILTWEDGVEDLVMAGDEGTVYIIDGNTGELYVDINVDTSLIAVAAADFEPDGFPEIVALNKTGTLFFIDSETEDVMSITYMPPLGEDEQNAEIFIANYDNDERMDIALSIQSTVYFLNGSSLDKIINEGEAPFDYFTSNDEAHTEILSILNGNFDTDNATELAIATDDGFVVLIDGNGETMSKIKAVDWIPWESQPLALVNLEELGIQALIVIGWDVISIIIDNSALYQMYVHVFTEEGEFNRTITKQQGDSTTIELEFRNIRNELIKDVSALLIAYNFDAFADREVIALTPEMGHYFAKVSTSDLLPGTWWIFLHATHDYYQDIIGLFEVEEPKLIGRLVIRAIPSVEIEFETDDGDFSFVQFESFVEIDEQFTKKVLRDQFEVGESLNITILPKDTGKNVLEGLNVSLSLGDDGYNVTKNYYTEELVFETETGNITETWRIFDGYSVFINTSDFWGGDYSMSLTISGNYVSPRRLIVDMTILPQQISIDFSDPTVVAILSIGSFLVAFILVGILRKIYTSLSTDFNATNPLLRRGSLIFSIIYILLVISAIVCVNLELYEEAFILSMILLGELVFLYLLFFFRAHFLNLVTLKFSFRRVLSNIGFIIIIFASLGLLIWIGSNIPWFDYEVAKDTNIIPYTEWEIPSLYWEVGVSGFLTGFIYIVIIQYIDTRGDIKSIKDLFFKAEEGHYPKDPDIVKDELIVQAQDSFITLIRGFVIWYVLIIVTITGSLKIWDVLQNIAMAVAAPFAIAAIILFRDKIHKLNPFS